MISPTRCSNCIRKYRCSCWSCFRYFCRPRNILGNRLTGKSNFYKFANRNNIFAKMSSKYKPFVCFQCAKWFKKWEISKQLLLGIGNLYLQKYSRQVAIAGWSLDWIRALIDMTFNSNCRPNWKRDGHLWRGSGESDGYGGYDIQYEKRQEIGESRTDVLSMDCADFVHASFMFLSTRLSVEDMGARTYGGNMQRR